jgi:putative serine protease PepD
MIGINTAVARSDATNAANNIGFAISTTEIQKIVGQLKSAGSTDARVEGYLGIGVADRHDGGRGAIVSDVQAGSPAADLGLQVGDVVTHVNGVEINGQGGLIAAIRDSAPGDTVAIDYERNGKTMHGDATLVARPKG